MFVGYVHGFRYIGIGNLAIWLRTSPSNRIAWNAPGRFRLITRWVRIAPRYKALEGDR